MSRKITLEQARKRALLSISKSKNEITDEEYEKRIVEILDSPSEEEICPCCNGTGRIEKKKFTRFEIMDI